MNYGLKSKVESLTTAISLVGFIPEASKLDERGVSVFYKQVRKITKNIHNHTDAHVLVSNFVLYSAINSPQNHNLKIFLLRHLVKFDSSWKELLKKETTPQ